MTAIAIALAVAGALGLGLWLGTRRGHVAACGKLEPRILDLADRLDEEAGARLDAEAEAEARHLLLRAALAASEDAVIVIDDAERIVGGNDRASTWFDPRDRTKPTLVSAIGSAALRDVVRDTVAGDAPPGVQTDVRFDDRVLRVTVVPTNDGRAVVAIRDATEQHRMARARRDMLANVSHDLRTPLSSLVLLVEMLVGDAHAERRADLVARIREQVATLATLAEALVEINSLETGRVLLRLEPMPLADLAGAAVEAIRPQLDDAHVTVRIDVPADAVVLVDRGHLMRVLTNLLDNALRYSPPHGLVTITSHPALEADRLEVRVSDDGPGITVADAQRVFERFYRADPARTGSGRGLGLAIARHVVEGHGGRIWVDAQSRRGATICFTLPRAD